MGNTNNKEIRVWCDGCYDMVHFGHANSFRQAKELGGKLIVGVHADEEIIKHKGRRPVFTQEERYELVKGIKWVDEVVEAAPYHTSPETLDKHNCKFCVHGEDITKTVDGKDAYQSVKDAKGRYKDVSRTAGVSTTDLIDRILSNKRSWIDCSLFAQRISQFNDGRTPKTNDKVIYVAGAFDLFHVGHLRFLEKAKQEGDYLIVGLHSDDLVNQYSKSYPVMNLFERALSVLACKYVDNIVFDAPFSIDESFIDHFKINKVCHGNTSAEDGGDVDPYAVARKRVEFKLIDSQSDVTTKKIIDRVIKNREDFETENIKDKEVECSTTAC